MSKTLRLVQPDQASAGEGSPWSKTVDAAPAGEARKDDLSRKVYGLLGIPVDAVDFPALLQAMAAAADNTAPFLVSTPNVNFLVTSQRNSQFRESMLSSDLCLADGMPLIWIAKLLQIPITERIAGADLFGRLKSTGGAVRQLKVFLLGGAEGVAATVARKLQEQECGLKCVGVLNPGYGTIEEMSTQGIIDAINLSEADLLAVFFGAEKAQAWLMHNHQNLRAPIRAQFGATINFEAGTVRRAPRFMRSTGFEWLWRIKEEPYLWRRYWNDATVLFRLLLTCVLPLAIAARRRQGTTEELTIRSSEGPASVTLELSGAAICPHAEKAIPYFRRALDTGKPVTIDLTHTRQVDPRFFGLFLMVRKHLAEAGRQLTLTGVSPPVRRIFRLNKFDFLLPREM